MNRVVKRAREFCDAVFDHAERFELNVSVVAVDTGGHLIALYRTDRTIFSASEAARRKAVAAAALHMPTATQAHMFQNDPLVVTALTASGDMLIVPGGFPMIVDGNCVGGFGIAGGHYSEDQMLGEHALATLAGQAGATA